MDKVFNSQKFSYDMRVMQAEKRHHNLNVTATEIGVSKATISRINREKVPDIYTYYACCKWLGKDMMYYFE